MRLSLLALICLSFLAVIPKGSSAQIAAPIRPGWVHFFAHSDSLHEDATDIDYAVPFTSGPTLQMTDTLYEFNRFIRRCYTCPPVYTYWDSALVPAYLIRASHFMGERYRAKTGRYVFEGPHKLQFIADATPGSFFTIDPVNLTAAEYVARYDTLVFGQPDTVARIRAPWGDFLISDTYGLLQWPDTSGNFSWQCIGIRGPDVGIQYPGARDLYSQWQPRAKFKVELNFCTSMLNCDLDLEQTVYTVKDRHWATADSGFIVADWSRVHKKGQYVGFPSEIPIQYTYSSKENDTIWQPMSMILPFPTRMNMQVPVVYPIL